MLAICYIVRHYPLWLPGSGWMKQALYVREILRQSLDIPYEKVAQGLVSIRGGTFRQQDVA